MATQCITAKEKEMTAEEAEVYIAKRLGCRDSILACEVSALIKWASITRFQPLEQSSLLNKLKEYRHLMDEAGCRILDEALSASSPIASSFATA